MRRFVLLACAVLSLVMSAEATTWQVTVQDFEFVPAMLTINQGDTVVWTNVQGTHNVLHACGTSLFGNAVGTAPWVYQFVFNIPAGDYPYLCEVHPNNMIGVISVLRVPQRWNVTVQNFSFTPPNLSVQQGDTVVWTNILGTHSVHHTGTPSLFDSGNPTIAPWTYTLVVSLPPATFPYVCELHPTMQGTLAVSAPPSVPAAPNDVVIHRSGDNANLYWTPISGANCYLIYLTQNSADLVFTQLAGITGDSTFVQPITALPGPKYFFQVRAVGQ